MVMLTSTTSRSWCCGWVRARKAYGEGFEKSGNRRGIGKARCRVFSCAEPGGWQLGALRGMRAGFPDGRQKA